MRIESVQIRNFRGFAKQTIFLDQYTCFVGANGAGKSTVLSALNIFFQESSNTTSVASLTSEDFHKENTAEPVEITVTFADLSDQAKDDLSHYVRHGKLVVTACATFDPHIGRAIVKQYGERLVFKKFAPFFEADKNKENVDDLRKIFDEITSGLDAFDAPGKRPTKAAMLSALRGYEEAHQELCTQERSDDQFYGSTKGKNKLEPFVQWIYLPAVKDASEETEEASNTALGKLLQRTVRKKIKFDEELESLRSKTREAYDALLEKQQNTLEEISERLAKRLEVFAHPGAGLAVEWIQGSEKSVLINDPKATVKAKEGTFKGSLARFGHGLQRSFLLAILQELASIENEEEGEDGAAQPTLIFACEEPELYQHPPQARHLATVLRSLADIDNQILLTTHSPYFVSGEAFEEIRLIRKERTSEKSYVTSTDFSRFAARIAKATGKAPDKPSVAKAKLFAALRPESAEIFFCPRLLFVEGMEDRAYITAALHLEGQWEAARRGGLHIVPANRKSEILQFLSIAQEFEIPSFVIFDADGDEKNNDRRSQHERDNKALITALGLDIDPFPKNIDCGRNHIIWPENIESAIVASIGKEEWENLCNTARRAFDPSTSLKKNPAFIGEALDVAWRENKRPEVLVQMVTRLKDFLVS